MPEERSAQRLLIVGNPDPIHVGAHFFNAAKASGISVRLCDTNSAYAASWPINKFNWWLRSRRPSRLDSFSEEVVEMCCSFQPHWLLSTGVSPIQKRALERIGKQGVKRLNFLTDDPWSPTQKTSWFMSALTQYDHVFSPRYSNLADLKGLGCKEIWYMPFAYAPELHFPDPSNTPGDLKQFASDIVFVGGADRERLPYMRALIGEGFTVALYGGYWERFRETKHHARGHADPSTVRKAISGAKVALCLVRRANRDGHSMRTFEVPAIGACMLVEDTAEHRQIFGPEKKAVLYFANIGEMIEQTRWLLKHEAERKRLARSAIELIRNHGNQYQDRLLTMLSRSDEGARTTTHKSVA